MPVSADIPPSVGDARIPTALVRAAGLVVALLAAVGVALAVQSATRGAPVDPTRPAYEVGIADPAPTSFGTVSVEFAEFLGGPTANALTGATHNVGALIPADRMQIEATVTLSNVSRDVVPYAPEQFTLLLDGADEPIVAKRASVGPGTLQPDAAIDVRLIFEAPLSTAAATLRFAESPNDAPVHMALGRHNGKPQRAHGEKPGAILGVGQQTHDPAVAGDGVSHESGHSATPNSRSP
jgi:hypothetical protein